MNIARPWDCEAFPKSNTICYGGGGGGGTPDIDLSGGSITLPEGLPTIPEINVPSSTGDIPIVKEIADQTGYTGSDLDKTGQHVETMAKKVLNVEGSTTSPDPTGTVESTVNNLIPDGNDILDTGINIITPPDTPGPGTGSTPQPTIAAGDTSTSTGSTTGLDEQVVIGASRRPQAMTGRRKTMLTIGQTAAKLNAKRSAGY